MPAVVGGERAKVSRRGNAWAGPICDYCYCARSLGIPWIVLPLLWCDTREAEQRICTPDTETLMVLPVCIGIYICQPQFSHLVTAGIPGLVWYMPGLEYHGKAGRNMSKLGPRSLLISLQIFVTKLWENSEYIMCILHSYTAQTSYEARPRILEVPWDVASLSQKPSTRYAFSCGYLSFPSGIAGDHSRNRSSREQCCGGDATPPTGRMSGWMEGRLVKLQKILKFPCIITK